MAKIFFDTEFLEDGKTIMPISIGMVRGDGAEYYAEFADIDWDRVYNDSWLMENVWPYLSGPLKRKEQIKSEILEFVGPNPVFWAYYSDYDWVLLCQLYGRMINLPDGWPMFCRDLRQERPNGLDFPKQESTKHNALEDARWVRDSYFWLKSINRGNNNNPEKG